MIEWVSILAEPLAPDCIGLALLFFVVLVWMHHLDTPRIRTLEEEHGHNRLHGIGHRLHELLTHRHH